MQMDKQHKKKHQDESWLREQYREKGRSIAEIADQCPVTAQTVHRWMKKLGVERRGPTESHHTRKDGEPRHQQADILRRLYHEEELSQGEIADRLDTSQRAVHRWMEKHDIETRDRVEAMATTKIQRPVPYSVGTRGYPIWRHSFDYEEDRVTVHRLVAVAEHGVDAVAGMDVHHKNGVKFDNRPQNLEILEHGEHTALHNHLRGEEQCNE